MANLTTEHKMLLALKAVKAYYGLTGEFQLGICGRFWVFYNGMFGAANDAEEKKLHNLIINWPQGTGSPNYPICLGASDAAKQFNEIMRKKDDLPYYTAYVTMRMELLNHMIKKLEDVCS